MAGAYRTTTPTQSLPAAQDGISVTPAGIADAWSAWVEVVPSAAGNLRLAGIIVRPGSFADGNHYEVEVGIGGAGSEVTVAGQRGYSGNNAGGTAESGSILTFALAADVIPVGSRIAVRLRQVSTNTSAWRIALQYYPLPISAASIMPASSVGPVNVPSGSRISLSTSASLGVAGSWVEVTSATDAIWLLSNVVCLGPNFVDWELDVGIGAAGSEVVRWTVKSTAAWFVSSNAWQGGPWNILLRPPFRIPSGVRLAVRIRSMNASGVKAFTAGFTVTKEDVSGVGTDDPMAWAPFALLTVPGGGWGVYSPWVEMIANTTGAIAVCQLSSTRDNTGLTLYEIGVGAPGFEQVVARGVAYHGVGFGGGRFTITLPYARLIPTGSRVAIRMTVQGTGAGLGHYVALGYIACTASTPDFDNYTDTVVENLYTNLPSSLVFQVFTGASAWQSGAWVQVDATVPEARVISAYTFDGLSVPVEAEFDLGIGAAGSEQVVATERWEATDAGSGCSFLYTLLATPVVLPVGERLALRARCGRVGATTLTFNLLYSAEPATPPPPPPPPVIGQDGCPVSNTFGT